MSYLSKIFKHLDGQTMTFEQLQEDICSTSVKKLPSSDWDDIYHEMVEMGWITHLTHSTIKFAICEDKREIKKRKETCKKHFIHHAAQRFIRDLKLGKTDIPARFKSGEYKEAVRELLHDSKLPE